jgi:hypothetical protein
MFGRVAAATVALIRQGKQPMDAEHTEKQDKIRELQAIIAKAKNGIMDCRYKTDCEFARACPGAC